MRTTKKEFKFDIEFVRQVAQKMKGKRVYRTREDRKNKDEMLGIMRDYRGRIV